MEEEKRENRGGLPDRPQEGEDRQIASAFEWRGQQLSEKKDERKTPRTGNRWYRAAIVVSILCAVSVFIFSLVASIRYTPDSDAPLRTESAEETKLREKIVYVRELSEDSGILTTPELYTQCVDSVVSVLTDSETGSGVGSGFLISSDGYIATAAHVIDGASMIQITLSDGRNYPAHLVGSNELTDLALLKIEERGLSAVSFGRSGELLIGEGIVAIGTPASLDYAGSVCSGEVSYLSRKVRIYDEKTGSLQKTMTLIQTDAALNAGNSGCPIFDHYGQVVGMVTMKLGADYTGIGFAIPSDGFQGILSAMMEGKEPDDSLLWEVAEPAPKLGIMGSRGAEGGMYGVRIHGFATESSSAAIMLKEGDLILRMDETPVLSEEELRKEVEKHHVGDTVMVTILRSGQVLSFEVILGE